MNCFQVDDSGGASEVEEILAQAAIAGSSSLLSADVSKAMFHGDAFAQKLATFGGSNELAQAMRPVAIPGEEIVVAVAREGKEPGQGVGSLDDGTMVVIQNGRRLLNQTITAVVTSVIQTSAGRMIFAEPSGTETRRQPARVKPREESS